MHLFEVFLDGDVQLLSRLHRCRFRCPGGRAGVQYHCWSRRNDSVLPEMGTCPSRNAHPLSRVNHFPTRAKDVGRRKKWPVFHSDMLEVDIVADYSQTRWIRQSALNMNPGPNTSARWSFWIWIASNKRAANRDWDVACLVPSGACRCTRTLRKTYHSRGKRAYSIERKKSNSQWKSWGRYKSLISDISIANTKTVIHLFNWRLDIKYFLLLAVIIWN